MQDSQDGNESSNTTSNAPDRAGFRIELPPNRHERLADLPNLARARTLPDSPSAEIAEPQWRTIRPRGQTLGDNERSRIPLPIRSEGQPERLDSIRERQAIPTRHATVSTRASTERPSNSPQIGQRRASVVSRSRFGTLHSARVQPIVRENTVTRRRRSTIRGPAQDASFSLAGQETAPIAQYQPYVEPGYEELNPAWAEPANSRPIWGLAKPLPRVLRPGMVPGPSELNARSDNQSVTGSVRPADTNSEMTTRIEDLQTVRPSVQNAVTLPVQELAEQREAALLQKYGILPAPAEFQEDQRHEPAPNVAESRHFPGLEEIDEHHALKTLRRTSSTISPGMGFEFSPDAEQGAGSIGAESDTDSIKGPNPWELITQAEYGDEVHNYHTQWSVIRAKYREFFAEFLGAFVQLTLAYCSDMSALITANPNGFSVTYSWGFATMIGIYIAGGISGAHLNPAVSIMLYVYRGFPLRRVPVYILAQLLAAFCAALVTFGLYHEAIKVFGGADLGNSGTAIAFITGRRHATVTTAIAFFNEFIATAFLGIAVLALGDDSNAPPGPGMSALILGFVITVLCMAFGYNTGSAVNPTRDFGSRLALLALGYGNELFTNAYWFYGPWAATILGAVVGGGVYDALIFVGGESPVNYPRKRIRRAGSKWKRRMGKRLKGEKIDHTLR